MRYSSTRPPYFRSQSRGIGRIKVFCIGFGVGAILVYLGMIAWQSQQPVEIIVKNESGGSVAVAAAASVPNDADHLWSEGGLVGVKNPKENDRVTASVTVEGLANPPDGVVYARVSELIRGKVVVVGEGKGNVKSDIAGTHGVFSISVPINPTRNQGTLEVSVVKSKNSKEVDTVIIPLQFAIEKKAATTPPKPAATAPVVPTP